MGALCVILMRAKLSSIEEEDLVKTVSYYGGASRALGYVNCMKVCMSSMRGMLIGIEGIYVWMTRIVEQVCV